MATNEPKIRSITRGGLNGGDNRFSYSLYIGEKPGGEGNDRPDEG